MRDAVTETSKVSTKSTTIGANRRLSLADAKSVSERSTTVDISPESYPEMERSFLFLKSCIEKRLPIYGINTQFGDQVNFLDFHLKNDNQELYYESIDARQDNLIKSHVCGLGDIVAPEIVRTAMMLRAHCLAQGFSGVNPHIPETILAFLNSGITPIVRRYGSIGASGDLIPLATIAAGIIGENVDVLYQDKIMKAPEAIKLAGLENCKVKFRDGLAMINGTCFMSAITSLAVYKMNRLLNQMLAAIAMSLESMKVITSGYHLLVHQLKRHSGELWINGFLLDFWQGSHLLTDLDELRETHLYQNTLTKPVQDYYSLRAVAQGFGPLKENLDRCIAWVENEMNSVNDNPIIDAENKKIHHCANFMGYYVTDACDILKMNIAQAATWLHALLANMVHPRKNHGLPTILVQDPSKQNGFRPIQLLAASLAVQARKLAQGHQAYMLPTEGDNQDVNSLGTHAAFDLAESVANLERLTAILLLASTQALEFRGIDKASHQSQKIHEVIRSYSPTLTDCRPMANDIVTIVKVLDEERI